MSFFKKLFGGETIEDSLYSTVHIMEQMANESERVHRNMVELYNKEIDAGMLYGSKSEVSWKGIFKTRLHAATYPFFIFSTKWSQKNEEKVMELMNIASGVALSSIHDSGMDYDRSEAEKLVMPILKQSTKGIRTELSSGPSDPSSNFFTDGFKNLEKISHDALSESIGKNNYSDEVKKRFELPVKSGVMSSLKHVTEKI